MILDWRPFGGHHLGGGFISTDMSWPIAHARNFLEEVGCQDDSRAMDVLQQGCFFRYKRPTRAQRYKTRLFVGDPQSDGLSFSFLPESLKGDG